jgi:hypothetical protein
VQRKDQAADGGQVIVGGDLCPRRPGCAPFRRPSARGLPGVVVGNGLGEGLVSLTSRGTL